MANLITILISFLILPSLFHHFFFTLHVTSYTPDPVSGFPINNYNHPPSPPRTLLRSSSTSSNKNIKIPIIASLAAAISFSLLFITGYLIFSCVTRTAARDENQPPSNTCRHFSIAKIRAATNNFDDRLIVGKGGFGNVYKGHIDTCRKPVAIKRLKPGSEQGAHEFQTEINMLSQFRHPHLVSFIGYCNDGVEMILVYDFMARGTLRDHLYGSEQQDSPLSWDQRLNICLAAARGLHFLHAGGGNRPSVIHRDVKSTNILLDGDWVAKVSDFGLSKVGPQYGSHVTTDVKGSLGYLDPEYYMSLWLTQKSDVYSFGVVMLEVLCGRPPITNRVEKQQEVLVTWVKKCFDDRNVDQTVDPALKGSIRPKCLKKYVEIALSCLDDHGRQRPPMRDVVKGLEYALNLQTCGSQGGAKGKNVRGEELDENFGRVEVHDECGNSKATTTCSEEEQAFVPGMSLSLKIQQHRN
ncbi:hypothetical protein VNO77_01477 [Canavalia gladiata]|uniref:Protein kinase domain-containing protein n=1 Tax=Canavalia gladiata TaxID=3824 RepID=A0AAN9MT62_CANGL